jgi:hypothetical protein
MRVQCLRSDDPNLVGAIAGAYPLFGSFMTAGYPNWATKYFADALVLRACTRDSPAGVGPRERAVAPAGDAETHAAR